MFDERIATDVSASQNSREMAGFVQIAATAAPGHALGELEARHPRGSRAPRADGPTDDEIERGRVQAEAQFMFRLQTVGGFGGKSDQLNAYNVFLGDPAYFDRDLARYRDVDQRSRCRRAVQRYLDPLARVTLSIVPQRPRRARRARLGVDGHRRLMARPGSTSRSVDRTRLPEPGPREPFAFPAIEKSTLPNGLRVWTVRHAQVPVVSLVLLVRRGAASDPAGKDGLAAIDRRHARRGQRRAVGDRDARGARAARRAVRYRHRLGRDRRSA